MHIPKGYIYFAMAFSVVVEMLNLRIRGERQPVHLRKSRISGDDGSAAAFDLSDGANILRILCGVFLMPHLVVKFRNQDFVKGFMDKAGLRPPSRGSMRRSWSRSSRRSG